MVQLTGIYIRNVTDSPLTLAVGLTIGAHTTLSIDPDSEDFDTIISNYSTVRDYIQRGWLVLMGGDSSTIIDGNGPVEVAYRQEEFIVSSSAEYLQLDHTPIALSVSATLNRVEVNDCYTVSAANKRLVWLAGAELPLDPSSYDVEEIRVFVSYMSID